MSRQRKLQKAHKKSRKRRSLHQRVRELASRHITASRINTLLLVILLVKVTILQHQVTELAVGLRQISNYVSDLFTSGITNLMDMREEFRAAVETILSLFNPSGGA